MKNSKKYWQVINVMFDSHFLIRRLITIIFIFSSVSFFSCKTYRYQPSKLNMSSIDYIKQYKDLAIKEMKRSNIPASITLAQGILESDNGNSTLARKANNHFGIKCHNWKGRKIYHDDDKKDDCFRKYKSVYESFKDHSDFITGSPRYNSLFDLKPTDYKGWARGLKKAGYATNPKYAKLLINLIEKYKLHQYDKGNKQVAYSGNSLEADRKIYKKNGVKYIIAKEGDNYRELAKKMEMMLWEIYKYNDLPRDASITPGQTIYIQPKRNKAARGNNYHVVKKGETMYTISQKYAIKLKKLYKKNNMESGQIPAPGQKLWLRKNKKEDKEDNKNNQQYQFDLD